MRHYGNSYFGSVIRQSYVSDMVKLAKASFFRRWYKTKPIFDEWLDGTNDCGSGHGSFENEQAGENYLLMS